MSVNKSAKIIVLSSMRLAAAHPTARATIRELIRSMNAYYSNRIEGQGTHPLHIEQAPRKEFSDRPDVARLQRVALAHIEAERELEDRIRQGESAMSSRFLLDAHHALYSRLAAGDRITEDGHEILPGEPRQSDVSVGAHIAPAAASFNAFLARMDQVYDPAMAWEAKLIAIACAHHRAAWVHPFMDGNRRAIRLQSHCALWPLTEGMWSPNRGLARSVETYYAKLHNADLPRRGDLDGCGNLTTQGLVEWIDFFLDVCADQVHIMQRMLELDGMKQRISALITFRSAHDKALRVEAILPLYHVFAAGPLTRREFAQMTGLGERTARGLLSRLLSAGLLKSESPLGPVSFGLPLDALLF